MNRPKKENYNISTVERELYSKNYIPDLNKYIDFLEEKRVLKPKKYDFEKDGFNNSTTEGLVDAIATIYQEIQNTSDMTFKNVIEYIMWNYDLDLEMMGFEDE